MHIATSSEKIYLSSEEKTEKLAARFFNHNQTFQKLDDKRAVMIFLNRGTDVDPELLL